METVLSPRIAVIERKESDSLVEQKSAQGRFDVRLLVRLAELTLCLALTGHATFLSNEGLETEEQDSDAIYLGKVVGQSCAGLCLPGACRLGQVLASVLPALGSGSRKSAGIPPTRAQSLVAGRK